MPQNEVFSQRDFTSKDMSRLQFESCTFDHCAIKDADIDNTSFIGCNFIEVIFKDITGKYPVWDTCTFDRCKMSYMYLTQSTVKNNMLRQCPDGSLIHLCGENTLVQEGNKRS